MSGSVVWDAWRYRCWTSCSITERKQLQCWNCLKILEYLVLFLQTNKEKNASLLMAVLSPRRNSKVYFLWFIFKIQQIHLQRRLNSNRFLFHPQRMKLKHPRTTRVQLILKWWRNHQRKRFVFFMFLLKRRIDNNLINKKYTLENEILKSIFHNYCGWSNRFQNEWNPTIFIWYLISWWCCSSSSWKWWLFHECYIGNWEGAPYPGSYSLHPQ